MSRKRFFASCIDRCTRRSPVVHRARFVSTYYDSQSGLHVSLHNENEISIFFDLRQAESNSMDSQWKAPGIHGLIVNELGNRGELPTNFRLFSYAVLPDSEEIEGRFSRVISYEQMDAEDKRSLAGRSTTFALGDGCFAEEPIMIANELARVIDEYTTVKDETFLWLAQTSSVDADQVLALCEELMYLDLPGSPVKARLLVNATDEEAVKETMLLGVNKFVVSREEQIEYVKGIAKQQGKELFKN